MPIQHSKSALMRQFKNEWRKNVQGYTLCPSQKAHSLATSQDCRNKVPVTAPQLSSTPCSPPPPLLHTQAHEKAAMRTAREPMRTAAERKDCPNGRALFINRSQYIILKIEVFTLTIFFVDPLFMGSPHSF